MSRNASPFLLRLIFAQLFLLGACDSGGGAPAADSGACAEGTRSCAGTRTAVCRDGIFVSFADCAADGWGCEEGRCAATGSETPTQAEYRARLDDLRCRSALTPVELDRFGGWDNAPESLGEPQPGDYFRVAKLEGAWWFVTPDGHPFVSKGVTDVNGLGATLSQGPYHDLIVEKYGTEDVWADASQDRLLNWNFNTVGPWSSHSMSLRMPHATIILDSAGHAPRYPNAVVTDYWSAGFAEHAVTVAQQRAAPYAEDENLIGYFLDNELVWSEEHYRTDKTLAQLYVEFPADAPGRAEVLRFVREAAGSLETFHATWRTNLSDWSQLASLPSSAFRPRTRAAREVTEAFMAAAFHRYASIAVAGLRSVDPHHLILGCRFHTYEKNAGDTLIRLAAEYFDVISLAYYEKRPPVFEMDGIWAEVDKPFLVEEWSFKARDSGLLNLQIYAPLVATQKDRALAYGRYVEAFVSRPYAVGYHWYKWFDNPWRGISDLFSGDNLGLMNPRDEPYEPFVTFVREANHQIEAWHARGGSIPE